MSVLMKGTMSSFHTATLCAHCDPPVVALSTGHGTRCPRCGRVEEYSSALMDAFDTQPDGVLGRQILTDMALRSDATAWLLCKLARRLLDRAGKQTGEVRAREELTTPEAAPTSDMFKRTALLERLSTTCQRCHTPDGVRFSRSATPGIAVYRCLKCGEFFRGVE